MKIPTSLPAQIARPASVLVLLLIVFAGRALAQLGPPGGQSQGTTAAQLPLSGRSGNGSVSASQAPIPGATESVNTLNPTVQAQGSFAGSAQSTSKMPFSGKLSLREAVERGVAYNLGAIGLTQAVRQAHGQSRIARSALLPNLNGNLSETVEEINLAADGLRIRLPIPGFSFPTIVGPFNYFDLRARLSQTLLDLTAWNNYRAANETAQANELSLQDAQDLTVLAVGGAYLQVIAAAARVESARAQLATATTLYDQTAQQRGVGLVAQVDVNRSQVEMLSQQQRLSSLQNDLAKQKINLARLTGLPPDDQYEITDVVPYSPAPELSLEDALKRAISQRFDLKTGEAEVRAAERVRSAAKAERAPSLSLSGDYGVIGVNPAEAHDTFSVTGTLRIPIWQGGRTEGDIEQADAAVAQRQAELQDLHARVESDVRNAYLDLQAAASQISVAQKNLQVTRETLDLTRQRFEAEVTDNLEVVQSQQSVAQAELDYIDSVFAHNVAKLTLARAIGRAAENLPQFLKLQ